ncbi:MAG: type II toxin-antitoxin system RelE family toxin [Limisphaerales bacterium]
MRTKVEVAPQVKEFVHSLAPLPRRNLARAIKSLSQNAGDRKLVEGNLAGYHRLRVANHRVIYREQSVAGTRVVFCLFAEHRSVVYQLFQKLLLEELSRQ